MFSDAFLPNLALFVLGQAAAWFYLRTGRFWIGATSTAALWVLADWAVVARWVFAAEGRDFFVPLVGMQIVAFAVATLLAVALWRRRWSKTAKGRNVRFGEGLAAYLREDLPAAQATFRRLVACNPWDTAALVALGNVERRMGRLGKAVQCYRRALGVDRARDYHNFVQQQLSRIMQGRGALTRSAAVMAPGSPPSPMRSRQA